MYKVRGKHYQRHIDASRAAVSASRIIPVHLKDFYLGQYAEEG